MDATYEAFTFIVRGLSIRFSVDIIVEILHIPIELNANPALEVVQQKDGTEELIGQLVPEDELSDKEVLG